MYAYQITVSLNGRFLFRTDWEDSQELAEANLTTLRTSLPLATVTMYRRSKVLQQIA